MWQTCDKCNIDLVLRAMQVFAGIALVLGQYYIPIVIAKLLAKLLIHCKLNLYSVELFYVCIYMYTIYRIGG